MRNDEPSSADEDEGSARAPTIGETLRAAREFHRASIERVAEFLRIEPRFIVALEEDRFDDIGPPVFVKGYLKHYCELLGIDPEPLLRELRERLRGAEPPLKARLPAEREKGPSSAVTIGVAAAVLVLAAVGVWQLGGSSRDRAVEPPAVAASEPAEPARTGDSGASAAAGTSARPAAVAAVLPGSAGVTGADAASGPDAEGVEPGTPNVTPEPGADDGGGSDPAGALDPAGASGAATPGPAGGTAASPDAAADGAAPMPTGGEAASPAAAAAAVTPAVADTTAQNPATSAAGGLEIELRFIEDSWTEITSAGGDRLFYGLARAGAEERIRADGEVRVLLGNADGVIIRVNGQPFAYPAGSRNGDLARFRLSPEN